MKTFMVFAAVTATLLFSACETDDARGKQNEMLEVNRQIVKGIETGDKALLEKYIASDAVDHGAGPNGEDIKGSDLINMLADMHNGIDNLKMEILEDAANDSHVFSLVKMSGTTNKPMWGMPANTPIDSKSVDVLIVKDGKATEHWGYYDMQEMMKMMQMSAQGASGTNADTSNMAMPDTTRQ